MCVKISKHTLINEGVRNTIKYNTSRQYFGNWTPAQLHYDYVKSLQSEDYRLFTISTGIISVDNICNTLWKEMSYNPDTFGKASPFIFMGRNSIKEFCRNYFVHNETQDKKFIVFRKIRNNLQSFMDLMKNYDSSFEKTGHTAKDYMQVGLEDGSTRANIEYRILSKLVACIHEICSQNQKDYATRQKNRSTMNQIIRNNTPCANQIDRQDLIKQTMTECDNLDKEIYAKNDEIYETQMHIDDLTYDIEAPVDISYEKRTLQRKKQELQDLQNKLEEKSRLLKQLNYGYQSQIVK